jgi:hypothetical protein
MGLAPPIGSHDDTLSGGDRPGDHEDHARDHHDHARDHHDHARDQDDRDGDHTEAEPFVRKPGHQYAENYPDPVTGHPLQTYPSRPPSEFDSTEDWLKYIDALTRWTNYLPPPRRLPKGDEFTGTVPAADAPRSRHGRSSLKSRHVGIRLTERDFAELDGFARAHGVPPGTMARILIVRAIRAVAQEDGR